MLVLVLTRQASKTELWGQVVAVVHLDSGAKAALLQALRKAREQD